MDYSCEPPHSELLNIQGNEPFNAEPPASALVEFNLTPEDLVYCRNHGPVREFEEDTYPFTVKGGVNQELNMTVKELKSNFTKVEVVAALQVRPASRNTGEFILFLSQCAGNRRKEMGAIKPVHGVAWADGVIANCKWGGVRLRDILNHAGVQAGYSQLCFASYATLCQDDEYYGASVPLERVMSVEDDVILAYEVSPTCIFVTSS